MENERKRSWGEFMDGELLESWPRTAEGELVEPAFLCARRSTDFSDKLLMNMLQAYGIPSLSLERGNGMLGRVYLGISGYGTDIYVPETLLDDAIKLCEEDYHEEEL